MADITKCINKLCPIKTKCYRWTAPSSDYQSVSKYVYSNGSCKHFWDNKDR